MKKFSQRDAVDHRMDITSKSFSKEGLTSCCFQAMPKDIIYTQCLKGSSHADSFWFEGLDVTYKKEHVGRFHIGLLWIDGTDVSCTGCHKEGCYTVSLMIEGTDVLYTDNLEGQYHIVLLCTDTPLRHRTECRGKDTVSLGIDGTDIF